MPSVIQQLETWADDELIAAKNAIEAAWVSLEPQILGLGKTVLSQVLTAAETYITTGGNMADAIGVIVSQLPADLKALETVIAGAFSAQVAKLQSAPVAPAAPVPPAAS